jgi:predicted RNA-binding Zn-ribbon protein involved in translation (DUF1610 family)
MNATRVSTPAFSISLFPNALSKTPKSLELSLDQLARSLTRFRLYPNLTDKKMLPAWSPARFQSGTTRSAQNVIDLSCLVLDLDTPPFRPEPWASYWYIRHSTWSHTEAHPRQRLILPLAKPLPAAKWPVAWAWAQQQEPSLDAHCRDAGRLYFCPALADPNQPHFAEVHPGVLLELVLSDPPPPPQPRRRLRVPFSERQRVLEQRLRLDPYTREQFAMGLGALVLGEGSGRRAAKLVCPQCGRASVWFPIAPLRSGKAWCNHKNSCGWSGNLTELGGGV